MLMNVKDMLGVRVETRSGSHVGKVGGFEFEVETGHLRNMHVKHGGLVAGLMSEHLLVSWDAIIELSSEKVIIADAAVAEGVPAMSTSVGSPISTAFMKERS